MPLYYIFLLLGLLTIFVEFFLPGGVFAVIGTLILLAGLVLSISSDPSPLSIFSYVTIMLFGLWMTVRFALYCIQHFTPRHGIFLHDDQEGFTASKWDKELIGKEGIVFSDLRPGGHVQIDGKTYSAISKSGYLSKGEEINVIDGEGETLYVVKKNETP